MDKITVAVIGGSGLYQMPGLTNLREQHIATPFGDPSDALLIGELSSASGASVPIAFLPRHGRGHVLSPSEVPYRANIYALKSLGVHTIIAVSACGSLREHLEPGAIVIPDQLFDFTKNRPRSFFGDAVATGLVAHVSVAEPFCPELSALLAGACEDAGARVHRGGALITIEGPRFSTKAESRAFRAWGLDLIGMTTSPEAFLAREAGLCYATMAHVTDYDVWHESEAPVTVEVVIQRLNANVNLAQHAIAELAPRLAQREAHCTCAEALATALITAPERIPAATREKLQLLTQPYL
ncbi:MAG: S-methyl-5'-thioadenosine phosphorylase [Anaerolineae bacterium]|jgi:5'-methylthioadenosine phosphorylase|nr:S-methyl-5'-thioadenosine phosphorylase [Anaerolineae bacterium]